MYNNRKPDSRGAEAGLNSGGQSPSTIGESSSHGSLLGNLGHLLPSDKAINPSDVYAITGEQLMQALQTAIAVGQSQNSCKQCERRSIRPPNVPLPTFNGNTDDKGYIAKNFLRKLECYVASQRYTYAEALEMVVPCALDGSAGLWWESEGEKFKNWHDFLRSFKKEYGVIEYVDTYRHMVENRTQNPDESLLEFINMIHCSYREFAPRAPDQEVISCILKQAHPECRILLKQKAFASVEELEDVAKEVDETLAEMRLYRQSSGDNEKSAPPTVAAAAAAAATTTSTTTTTTTTRTPSPVALVKEDSPDMTPTKEANPPRTWNSGKVNAVSPNYRFEEKDVFLPPWAEKDQPRKQYGANAAKSNLGKPSFNKFQKMYTRKQQQASANESSVFRCYACGGCGHSAHNCRKVRHPFHKNMNENWFGF